MESDPTSRCFQDDIVATSEPMWLGGGGGLFSSRDRFADVILLFLNFLAARSEQAACESGQKEVREGGRKRAGEASPAVTVAGPSGSHATCLVYVSK